MKKIVSLVIVLTMMLCMFPISSMTASAVTEEHIDLTGYADYSTYIAEDRTEYRVIRTAEAFKNIKNAINKNYILACDINFDGEVFKTPLTYDGAGYGMILNGNGYSIYNFSVDYTGTWATTGILFQKLKSGSKIENLSIGREGTPISYTVNGSNATGVGVIAGMIDTTVTDSDTVTISDVDIYCNINFNKAITNSINIGGFVGYTHTAGNVDITNSSFTGKISFSESAVVSGQNTRVGAFVGYCKGGTLDIEGSVNNTNVDITNRVSLSSDNYSYAGGFVGRFEGNCNFTDCINNGNIISDKASGGIAASGTKSAIFTRCVNTGNVTSNSYSGGILGMAFFGVASTEIFDFYNCINNGNISSSYGDVPPSGSKYAAGGIIGIANFGIYRLNNCGNTGNISADNAKSSGEIRAAGMIGNSYTSGENATGIINNCFSTGTISSSLKNDTRTLSAVAICSGSNAGTKFVLTSCVWNMTFNDAKIESAASGYVTVDDTNMAKNILAKETSNAYEAYVQKSNDNTKIRVLLLSNSATLPANTDVVIKIWCGDSGKQFTVPASKIFALESVDAAGETYYGVGGAYIFGAVVTGIPEDIMKTVTDVTVVYGEDYSADFTMTK